MSLYQAPPAFLTSFVGRAADVESVTGALADARLVTLAGPGGGGKTRLAAEVAERAAGRWPDGVCWIDLTATTAPSAVPELVAGALDVLVAADQDAVPALAWQLSGRRMLICLDNCEHVLAAAADVVAAILRAGQGVTVLATSREPMGIPGEVVWRVPPLRSEDAVALFQARAGRPADTEEAMSAIRTACARLDGMPLGVELAAAWSGTLSPQEIVTGLDDRFRLLIRGPHGVAARHQTLAASMDWSHDLLDEVDRTLFRGLAVFHGGFTAATANGVCPGSVDVLGGLRRLIEKSLLVADTRSDVTRYRMLETVRQYAVARLDASGELDRVQDRHLDTFLALAESARPLLDEDKDAWRAVIGADYENFCAAIDWGLDRDDRARRLTAELAWFWHFSRRGDEGLDRLRRAIGIGTGQRTGLQARLLTGLALVADTTRPVASDYDAARVALDIAGEVGDARTGCLAAQLSGVSLIATDFDAAWELAATADKTARDIGYGFGSDGAQALMGIVCHLRDQHDLAMPLLQAAVDGLVPRGDRGVAATALGCLATSAAMTGDLPRARALAVEGVRVAGPLGDFHRVGSAHAVLALVAGLAGRFDEAWAALAPVLRLVESATSPPHIPGLTECMGSLHLWNGRPDLALLSYEHGTAGFGEPGDDFLTPRHRIGLATALLRTGDSEAAEAQVTLALGVARDLGMPGLVADAQEVLAELAGGERAEELHHAALALRVEHGLRLACMHSLEAIAGLAADAGSAVQASRIMGACDRARDELGHPRSPALSATVPGDTAFAEGRDLTLDEAIAYARRSRGTRSRRSSGWASLTPTEHSVVALVVDGLNNPDIAKRLFMSRATVKTHLSHVYAKLGVANRTELATAALRNPTTS